MIDLETLFYDNFDDDNNQFTEEQLINEQIINKKLIEDQLIDIDLSNSFIFDNKYIIIDCEEYNHYIFIDYSLFYDFIKSNITIENNYYTLKLTKNNYSVTYQLNSIDKICYYVYYYHTKKINN